MAVVLHRALLIDAAPSPRIEQPARHQHLTDRLQDVREIRSWHVEQAVQVAEVPPGVYLERLLLLAVACGRRRRPVRLAEAGNDSVVLLHGRDRTLGTCIRSVADVPRWRTRAGVGRAPGRTRPSSAWVAVLFPVCLSPPAKGFLNLADPGRRGRGPFRPSSGGTAGIVDLAELRSGAHTCPLDQIFPAQGGQPGARGKARPREPEPQHAFE